MSLRQPAGNATDEMGQALTAVKMKKCILVNPELVVQIEFLEWTESDHI